MPMMLLKIDETTGHNRATVILASRDRTDLGMSTAARQYAADATRHFLARPGFDKLGSYGYIPEALVMQITPGTMETPGWLEKAQLTEAEMQAGGVKPGEGLWVQEYVVAGSP